MLCTHCFEGQGISTQFWVGGISKGIKAGMAFQVQVYDLRLLFLYRAFLVSSLLSWPCFLLLTQVLFSNPHTHMYKMNGWASLIKHISGAFLVSIHLHWYVVFLCFPDRCIINPFLIISTTVIWHYATDQKPSAEILVHVVPTLLSNVHCQFLPLPPCILLQLCYSAFQITLTTLRCDTGRGGRSEEDGTKLAKAISAVLRSPVIDVADLASVLQKQRCWDVDM